MSGLLVLVIWLVSCFALGCITGIVIHRFVLKPRVKDVASGLHDGERSAMKTRSRSLGTPFTPTGR